MVDSTIALRRYKAMSNQFVSWLNEKRGGQSMRSFARDLGLSHGYIIKVLTEKEPPTWKFCATVAERMGVPAMTVFEMAGLLPVKGGKDA
jgi:hypothetical protein